MAADHGRAARDRARLAAKPGKQKPRPRMNADGAEKTERETGRAYFAAKTLEQPLRAPGIGKMLARAAQMLTFTSVPSQAAMQNDLC